MAVPGLLSSGTRPLEPFFRFLEPFVRYAVKCVLGHLYAFPVVIPGHFVTGRRIIAVPRDEFFQAHALGKLRGHPEVRFCLTGRFYALAGELAAAFGAAENSALLVNKGRRQYHVGELRGSCREDVGNYEKPVLHSFPVLVAVR